MILKPLLLIIPLIAANSPASTTKSEVDIFPLFTAIPASSPTMNFALATKTPNEHSASVTATPQRSRGLLNFARFLPFMQRLPNSSEPPETQVTGLKMPSYGTETSQPRKSSKHAATKKAKTTQSAADEDVNDRDDPATTTPKHKTASKKKKKTTTQTASIADVKTSAYALPSIISYALPSRNSRMTQAKGGEHTVSITPAASGPIRITTKLWHPAQSNANKIGIPKLLLGLLSLRATVVGAQILPRAEASPSITTTPIPTTLVPFVVRPNAAALTCPEGQEHCGYNLCYQPKTDWCCPGEAIVCAGGQRCASGRMQDGTMVYACAPADAKDGNDSRIYTGSMITVRPTATGSATLPKPTGNSGARLGVPSMVKHLALLGNVVRAVAFPSELFGECCMGICCKPGESCTRSLEGPKCWPGVEANVAEADPANEEKHTSAVVTVHDIARSEAGSTDSVDAEAAEVENGGGVRGVIKIGGGLQGIGGQHKSGAGDRLTFMALHIFGAAGLASLIHRWF